MTWTQTVPSPWPTRCPTRFTWNSFGTLLPHFSISTAPLSANHPLCVHATIQSRLQRHWRCRSRSVRACSGQLPLASWTRVRDDGRSACNGDCATPLTPPACAWLRAGWNTQSLAVTACKLSQMLCLTATRWNPSSQWRVSHAVDFLLELRNLSSTLPWSLFFPAALGRVYGIEGSHPFINTISETLDNNMEPDRKEQGM